MQPNRHQDKKEHLQLYTHTHTHKYDNRNMTKKFIGFSCRKMFSNLYIYKYKRIYTVYTVYIYTKYIGDVLRKLRIYPQQSQTHHTHTLNNYAMIEEQTQPHTHSEVI